MTQVVRTIIGDVALMYILQYTNMIMKKAKQMKMVLHTINLQKMKQQQFLIVSLEQLKRVGNHFGE